MTDYLRQKFLNYTTSVPREEIYIHSDRDEYISGENLWFNIYLIDRQSFKPSSGSKIAYFELLNPENRPIVQKRILLEGGFGPGQIVLPDTLSSGIYTIRAYTNWMKNFLPVNCFTKDIHIYNAFSSRSFKEKIYSGKKISEGTSVDYYHAASNAGLNLRVDNLKPDILEIDVVTDEKYRTENKNQFYLFIQTHGNINYVSSEGTTDGYNKIFINKNQLPAGINQITVFNAKGQPVGERFIYTPEKENTVVTIQSIDSSGLRDKISLDFAFPDTIPNKLNSNNLSISVVAETNSQSFPDINDYMIFGTEYGLLPGDVFKGIKVSKIAPEIVDSLLQSAKSNWLDWNVILSGEPPVFKYKIETEDYYLSGKLLTGDRKEKDSDRYVILSHPGKIADFQYARTDREGDFSFKIKIDDKVNDLIIQPNEVTKNQSVNIESSFSDKYLKSEISVDSTSKPIPGYISTWSVNHQVMKIYGTSSIGEPIKPDISQPKTRRFYGKPDQELNMKDYITLPVMQEVFFELLVGVSLKNKKSGYEITISDPEYHIVYKTPPALFVDGVLVKDPEVIAGLDPEIVEKIDVIRGRYFVGDYFFYGIVNVITKAGDFSNVTLPDYAIRLSYRVIDQVNSFISPDYSSTAMKKNRIPDFRNTLYWNPSVKPDQDGKARVEFWSSDNKTDYLINIQGITQEGKPFSFQKNIKVK
ncbi:MAG: hypothetical protein ABSA76_05295 [Bacteroidales bacterium]